MELNLHKKIALVTGGAIGIGRECCLGLAKAGATVVIHYNRSQDEAEALKRDLGALGCGAVSFRADISNPIEVRALFDYVRDACHGLDILVNNAGIIRDKLLLSMDLSDWEKVYEVDLRGPFLTSRMAVEMMLPNHRGKIVNIASISAIRGGKGQTNYAAAKGGLISFTRSCAVELAGKNIQVNAVLPGVIRTGMSRRVRRRAGERILKQIPASRFGEPWEVANLVLFLASRESDYITGQAICVDGGLSVS